MRRPSLHVSLIIAMMAIGFAGCIDGPSSSDEPSHYQWGLGLTLPEELPSPGEFLEPMDEIDYWSSFLDGDVVEAREVCAKGSPREIGDPGPYDIRWKLDIRLLGHCYSPPGDIRMLHDQARVALEENWTLFPTEGLANVSSVEIMAFLMGKYLGKVLTFERIEGTYHEYLEAPTSQNKTYLERHYRSQIGLTMLMRGLLPRLALEGDACHEDSAMTDTTMQRISALVERIERTPLLEEHGHTKSTDDPGGWVLFSHPEAVQAFEWGWWPYLVLLASRLPSGEAYIDYAENGTLATIEEARYLRALKMSEMRTVYTGSLFFYLAPVDQPASLWTTAPPWALIVQALQHLEWRFGDLDCYQDLSK